MIGSKCDVGCIGSCSFLFHPWGEVLSSGNASLLSPRVRQQPMITKNSYQDQQLPPICHGHTIPYTPNALVERLVGRDEIRKPHELNLNEHLHHNRRPVKDRLALVTLTRALGKPRDEAHFRLHRLHRLPLPSDKRFEIRVILMGRLTHEAFRWPCRSHESSCVL